MMSSAAAPSQTSLFGIELADLWTSLARPWRNLYRSGRLAWLAPQAQVRLVQADGGESVWEGDRQVAGASSGRAPFIAAELPEDLCLRRSLVLPPMEAADLENAVALDVQSASPFEAQDMAWGCRARASGEQQAVEVAFASRRQVGNYLEGLRSRLPAGAAPEVWVRSEHGDPIVLKGYGEERRARHVASRWKLGLALVALAAALATAAAVTPTMQLRLRAIQASQAYDEATRRAQPLLAKREKMTQAGADMAALNTLMAKRVDAAYAMDYLTRIIPDDTYLISLNIQGGKAVLIGQTGNAAALMQRLSGEPGLRDVRAPSPAVRSMGSAKETFTVEFTFDPRPAGGVPAPAAASVSTLTPAPAAAAIPAPSTSAASAPAAAPQSPTQTAVPAVPAPHAAPAAVAAPPTSATPQAAPGAAAGSSFVIGGTRPKAPAAPAPAAGGRP